MHIYTIQYSIIVFYHVCAKTARRWTQDDNKMAFKMTTRWLSRWPQDVPRWLPDYSSSKAFREDRLHMNHYKHPFFTGSGKGVKAARAVM